MAVLIDTSFFVSYYDSRDQNHEKAKSLLLEIETGKFGELVTCDYVLDETSTILKKYLGTKAASEKTEQILRSVKFLMINRILFESALLIFKKFEKLSFTDCFLLVLMHDFRIDYLATFDSGFDGLVRVLR